MAEQIVSMYREVVSGKCNHCEWKAIATSYPEMVEMYHDHLRGDHPAAWMRA
ncbi:hypothetical protein C499_05573 [Halogeometricum borinquense DSM 11551]|uniref:Uncharacterized protein n=2 Tax=Halogeometricum borinquense (strain ATCC 700274 / DSM 11551 / JCM 10706 / KCTC 4070 / PR3) TaxID=469382 RepID=L9V047_HALBP|nr:hypothetical protein [Halogeometricum borinquense]ELY29748.1 hypothetical protein C499_05573 [Halogeometricum borinquense DSM 11551]